MFKKIKENKALNILGKILYTLLVVFVLMILFVVILQRVSNNSISLGGFRIFNVVSESMVPKYVIGDVLLSKTADPAKIKVGDDVVYKGEVGDFSGRIVTHQVIQANKVGDKYKFITKGIANPAEDPEISGEQIYGVIIGEVPVISSISKLLNNLYSLYFFIFVPMVIIVFVEIRKVILNIKEAKEEKEENKKKEEENNEEDN